MDFSHYTKNANSSQRTQKIPSSPGLIMPFCPRTTRTGSEDGLTVTQLCMAEWNDVSHTVMQTPSLGHFRESFQVRSLGCHWVHHVGRSPLAISCSLRLMESPYPLDSLGDEFLLQSAVGLGTIWCPQLILNLLNASVLPDFLLQLTDSPRPPRAYAVVPNHPNAATL